MKCRSLVRRMLVLMWVFLLSGCATERKSRHDDPFYSPVFAVKPVAPENNSGSLFQPGYGMQLYEDRLARRVGDIITVMLSEKTVSSKSTGSNVKKNDKQDWKGSASFGAPVGQDVGVKTETKKEFSGSADADQSNSLEGSITVTVVDVLPNGVLVVRGEKWLTLTRGDEFIRITGLVRPEDIRPDNSVISTRIADARISYSGSGQLSDSTAQGWASRFFNGKWFPL